MKKILLLAPASVQKASGIATYIDSFVKQFPSGNIVPLFVRCPLTILLVVKKQKIDTLFIHDALLFGKVAWIVKKFFHKPYLIFSHGVDINTASVSKYKLFWLSRIAKHAEQIITDSGFIKKHWLKLLPQLESKITVVYPCPEADWFGASDSGEIESLRSHFALNGKRVILTISRLTDGKGVPHLLRIMPEILKSVPNLVWVLIGDGPKKKSVMEMIQKNNLQNVVRFLGEVPHNELKKFYHLAESFVLLTHPDEGKEEGVGMVFLEAAACGVPCVAGKSGGVPEAVRDGETGVLVDIYRGDELLIKQIVDLLGDRERLQRLGNNAKLRVQYDFRWDSQLAKIKQWL